MFYDHFALNHRASDNNFIRSSSIVDFFFRSRQSLVSDSLLFDRGLHGSSVPSWIIFGDQLSSVSRGRYWVIEVSQSIFLRGGFIHRGNFSSACHAKSSSSSHDGRPRPSQMATPPCPMVAYLLLPLLLFLFQQNQGRWRPLSWWRWWWLSEREVDWDGRNKLNNGFDHVSVSPFL